MQNDGKFPSNSDLRLFHSVAFGQPKAPSLERAPTLRAMEQDTGRLEEIRSQQTIAPSRDLTDSVRLPGLLTSWCQSQIGTYGCRTSKARRVVNGMAEGQCRHHTDARHGHGPPCYFVSPSHLPDLAIQPLKFSTAYVKARYSKRFEISEEALAWLQDRTAELHALIEALCREHINKLQQVAKS